MAIQGGLAKICIESIVYEMTITCCSIIVAVVGVFVRARGRLVVRAVEMVEAGTV
jgi:vacuolar-type H+-ATPase subunit I/STV1